MKLFHKKESLQQKVRLLVIGQTPPPYGGQAIMIHKLVHATFEDVEIHHVRMNYSRAFHEVGRFSMRKIFHLLRVLLLSIYKVFRYNIQVIQYPPGATTIPLLRDMVTLLVLRRLGRKLVLLFQASGLSEIASTWKGCRLWLFRKAFFYPEAAVQTSILNPPDGSFVRAKKIYVVPNGSEDEFEKYREKRQPHAVPVILYVGVVREDKGVNVLLEAAHLLKGWGHFFSVKVVGELVSEEYRKRLLTERSEKELENCFEFVGPKIGPEKWMLYRNADVFCFPSFFEAESFGIVLVEAMMFELPVVSTRWRGIPSVVEDGVTGLLVEIKSPYHVAEALARLIKNESLRKSMGEHGRKRYLQEFTLEKHLERMREAFIETAFPPKEDQSSIVSGGPE